MCAERSLFEMELAIDVSTAATAWAVADLLSQTSPKSLISPIATWAYARDGGLTPKALVGMWMDLLALVGRAWRPLSRPLDCG